MSLYLDQQHTAPVWQGPRPSGNEEIPLDREEWVTQATCRQVDPDALFVKGAQQRSAAAICRPCRVRNHCLVTALDNREEFGVWGGLTERQRRALLRKHSHIDNWADHLTVNGELVGI
ncbi:WhiB family transcriptional regulator [Corynebacterium halotolerans]|uniref:WhiB family transcriptional regulator n=1 Tax=Corynebacterium halotolerans TaxID=225326 RepID=UPI003CE80E98